MTSATIAPPKPRRATSIARLQTRVIETPNMHLWRCDDTVRELRGDAPRTLAVHRRELSGVALTWSDYFCGAGGSSSGIELVPGASVVLAVNHWKLAIETHNYNLPHADHDQANVARTDPRRYPRTDCAWFSPECFPAGTTILTRRGLVPVDQVMVGDEVWTHRLRWRPVTSVMSKFSDTVTVAGYGHPGLETTADHPLYARTSQPSYSTRKGGRPHRVPRRFGDPEWTRAADLGKGHYWASPTEFGETEPPVVSGRGIVFDGDFWWLVGRWLGDGCLRSARGEVQVTCGLHEADDLGKRLAEVAPPAGQRAGNRELRWTRRDMRTAAVFTSSHRGLATWLRQHFGEHAAGKTVPAWALAMRRAWREALLEGYASADGGLIELPGQRPIVACNTVSRRLAVGVRLLALSLGWKASLVVSKRTDGFIEGRAIKMRPLWRVQWCIDPDPSKEQTLAEEGLRWCPVRKVEPGRSDVEVFNLSVAEDESYLADGMVVHNCTFWTVARGDKCDYDSDQMYLDGMEPEEDPLSEDAKRRSRMLMRDVVRFSRQHGYLVVVVENVPDILKWARFDDWVAEMRAEGYRHKVVVLNSAFAQAFGDPAPQLRDRVYVAFWKANIRTPDWNKWLRPYGWCPSCNEVVRAIYSPKPGPRRPMRYRAQYGYRCPSTCRSMVHPYALPAASVVDLSRPGQRIGDRKRALAVATRDRIADGLVRHTWPSDAKTSTRSGCPPMLVPTGGTRRRNAASVEVPMATRTTRENDAVVTPPPSMVVPLEGRDGLRARSIDEPLRTQTGRHTDALVVPLRNNGVARPAAEHPLMTVAAGGEHQALVSGGSALYSYDSGLMRPLTEPLPTQTGVEGDALISRLAQEVDDCFLRMLTEDEVKDGTGFDRRVLGREFTLLGTAKRDKIKMVGNAVTPPTSRDLAACLQEAVTGIDIPLYEGWVR